MILEHILHEPQSELARLSSIRSLRYPWFSFLSFLLDSFPWYQFPPKTTCIQTFVSGSAFGEIQAKTVVLCSVISEEMSEFWGRKSGRYPEEECFRPEQMLWDMLACFGINMKPTQVVWSGHWGVSVIRGRVPEEAACRLVEPYMSSKGVWILFWVTKGVNGGFWANACIWKMFLKDIILFPLFRITYRVARIVLPRPLRRFLP